jgi:hypothetical protein
MAILNMKKSIAMHAERKVQQLLKNHFAIIAIRNFRIKYWKITTIFINYSIYTKTPPPPQACRPEGSGKTRIHLRADSVLSAGGWATGMRSSR